MIEATDVRVGNLVWYYDYNLIETTFRVEGIWDGYVYNSGLPKSKLPLEKVNPIPLDADQLENLGFIAGDKAYGEDPHTWSYKYTRTSSIYVREEGTYFQPVVQSPSGPVPYGRPLVHLHQLQNLFYDLTRDDVFTH